MLHIVKEEKTPETALWAVAALSCPVPCPDLVRSGWWHDTVTWLPGH